MSFNPNATQTLGVEWPVTLTALNFVDATSKGHVERFTSSASETIDKIEVYLKEIGDPGLYGIEVYEAGGFVPSNQHTERSTPRTSTGQNTQNDDENFPWMDAGGNAVGSSDFSKTFPDEDATDNWDDSFYIQNADDFIQHAHLSFRGGHGQNNFNGKRILRVDMWVRWKSAGGIAAAFPTLENDAGTDLIFGTPRAIPISANFSNTRLARMDANPLTGRPWTAAEATEFFSDTSTKRWGLRADFATLSTAIKISALWCNIVVADENREALGSLIISQNDGWKSFNMSQPDGTDNWAKAADTEYDVLLHRLTPSLFRSDLSDGSLAWPYLSAQDQFCPHVGHRAIVGVLNGEYGTGANYGNGETKRAHPIRFVTTGAADSADSQPYARMGYAEIYSGSTWRSEFNGAASAGYGFIKAVIRPAIGAPSDLADLTVKVKRTSDDVQLGGTATLTKLQVDDLPDVSNGAGWKHVGIQIATATLATSTSYYIEFSSTAGGGVETRRWNLAYISAEGKPSATYGGSGQSINIGGVDFTDADFVATIAVPPATPSGWSTELVTL